MGYFQNIKNGVLPQDQDIINILNNGIDDEYQRYRDEIEEYIKLLQNAYDNNDLIHEKILLLYVLFVLESYKDGYKAQENFIRRFIRFNIHADIKNFVLSLEDILCYFNEERIFFTLKDELLFLDILSQEEFRSFFGWCLNVLWNFKIFLNHERWFSLYENLKILLSNLVQKDRISDVLYVEFFIYHVIGNSFQKIDQWRNYNNEIIQFTEPFYKKFAENLQQNKVWAKERKKIGFIKDRVVENSVFKVEYSLFQTLNKDPQFIDRYEIVVYSVNYIEKSDDDPKCIEMLEQIGISYVNPVMEFQSFGYYNDHFQKALKFRERIIRDGVDIMISGGGYPIIDFLYLSQVAPLQIYYSHGNCAFAVDGIDKRMSHFPQECNEYLYDLIDISISKELLKGSIQEQKKGLQLKQEYKKNFGEDVVILGTIGRLVKLNSDVFIQVIGEILQANPHAIYMACGGGNALEEIKRKLIKYKIDQKRFIFTGHINPHVYGWVIDVFLDTFPLRGGNAKAEYMAKGYGVVVTNLQAYSGDVYRTTKELKRRYTDIEYPIAANKEEYVFYTNKMIKDKLYRNNIASLQQQRVLETKQTAKQFMTILGDG